MMNGSACVSDAPAVDVSALRWPIAGGALLASILYFVFDDFLNRQFAFATEQQADWGHTLVIPFISAYFIYLNRHKLLATGFRTTWIGLVPVVLGVAWYALVSLGPQALRHHNLQGAGLGLTLFGLALLFCGFRAMSWLWFPLVYLVIFGQTISERLMNIVTFQLQDLAARGSHVLLVLIGHDVERAGNTLTLFKNGEAVPLNIAEACSGMRMLMAFLALGVAMAYTGLRWNWQRIVLVVMAVPTAIFVNMLRVVTLGQLALIDVDFAAGDFHTFVGLVWLVPAFLIYLAIMWAVKQVIIEESPATSAAASPETAQRS